MKKLLPIGKLSKLYGKEGELILSLYREFSGNLNIEEPLYVHIDGLAVPLFIELFQRRGERNAVIRLSDIDNEKRATELLSKELLLKSDARSGAAKKESSSVDNTKSDGQTYLEDLVGYRAVIIEENKMWEESEEEQKKGSGIFGLRKKAQKSISERIKNGTFEIVHTIQGEVVEFLESEVNPLLVIKLEQGKGEEVLIPANDEFIEEIDLDSQTVYLVVPEGLLDLNL